MAKALKKRRTKRRKARTHPAGLKHVVVTARNYGTKLKGVKIFYEGSKPRGLRPDGTINLGKDIFEILTKSPSLSHFEGFIVSNCYALPL